MKKRINKMWVGTLFGLLVPFLALFVYVVVKFDDPNLINFLKSYFQMGILTHMLSLAVIPNLIVFFAFVNNDYLQAGRGVLLSTFLFAFAVLIIRFT